MRSLYSHAHRQVLLPLLNAFSFSTDNLEGKALLQAIAFIKANKHISLEHYPDAKLVPIEGVVQSNWRTAVLDTEDDSQEIEPTFKVNRMNYEMAVLEELRRQLRCKLIWIEGAFRYRNPDEDSPEDFDSRHEHYYQMLDLPLKAEEFIKPLQASVDQHLQALNDSILDNAKVSIVATKDSDKGKFKVTPNEAQGPPVNLKALQQAIKRRFSTISLLDILKEADLRINFTQHFHTVSSKESVDKAKLRKRVCRELINF